MKPSTLGENRSSVLLALHMETQHKLEIGQRIRELRSRSPFTQANVADRLGITLRAYQRLEEVGTTRWERCQELAELYDTTAEWIWDGEEKGAVPDVLQSLNGSHQAQLDRIEGALNRLLIASGLEEQDRVGDDEQRQDAVPEPLLPSERDRPETSEVERPAVAQRDAVRSRQAR